ncbi:cytochrome P450 [Streptomyces natalensis]|uniref:cytochrome P450 n=1 Tax=Streptomyces natalensis TaxID=68242 RepID=UPI0012FEAE65|nr:cytochrome P450 [Streptomyces natalensis]
MNSSGLHAEILKALSPRSDSGLAEWMTARAHDLLDEIVRQGPPVDLRDWYAAPFSGALLCKILGLPYRDWRQLMSGLDLAFVTSPDAYDGCTANWDKDYAYVLDQLRTDRSRQSGPIRRLCELKDTEQDSRHGPGPTSGGLTDAQIAAFVTSLFGAVSTSAFLLHAVLALVRHPGTVARLRADPGLMESAVGELLRHTMSIGDGLPRIATADTELGDVLIRSGELVLVCVEAANFDPAVFGEPERLDIGRHPNPHLSLGAGRHYCPASALSCVHARVALTALLERLPDLRLAVLVDQLVWRTGYIKRLPERLPVLWGTPAAH